MELPRLMWDGCWLTSIHGCRQVLLKFLHLSLLARGCLCYKQVKNERGFDSAQIPRSKKRDLIPQAGISVGPIELAVLPSLSHHCRAPELDSGQMQK